jgi:5,10-methylenetetrahydromethanopterin reductase
MLELAASVADGVYVGTGLTADVFEATTALLRGASERAGRDFEELDVWWVTRCAVDGSAPAAVAAVRESLSSMGNHALRGDYGTKLVPAALHGPLSEYHRRYDYAAKNAVGGAYSNADLMDELGLTPYFLDRFGVVGTPDDVVVRLTELRRHGFENVHLGAEGADALDLLGRGVLPRVRNGGGRPVEHRDD